MSIFLLLKNFYFCVVMVIKVNDSEFKNELESGSKFMVKYYADWCGNCRLFAPKYKKISEKEAYQNIKFLEVNAEQNPEARDLGNVKNLPSFAIFQDGKLIKSDATSKEEIVENMVISLING